MTDAFLLIVRWLHVIAAVAWVGGGVFYWLVLRPAIRVGAVPAQVSKFASMEFGQIVLMAMWTLVLTGAILLFTRLSEPTATLPYGVVLGVKIALSAWMFFLTLNRGGRTPEVSDQGRIRSAVNALGHVNMTVVLGIIVFLLSDILRLLVEHELGS